MFGLFQTNNTILQQINVKNVSSSNPRPLEHEPSPVTTGPGLLAMSPYNIASFFLCHFIVYQFFLLFVSSVTRFGEISSLGQNFKRFGKFKMVYLVFGKLLNLLWQISWANFHRYKWPKIEKLNYSSGHTVRLSLSLSLSLLSLCSR